MHRTLKLEATKENVTLTATDLEIGIRVVVPGIEVETAGSRIRDLHVERPTLQAVFIHLTGRELRE